MIVRIYKDKSSLAENAAKKAAVVVRQVLSQNGKATIVVATGNSQIDFLNALTQEPEIDWGKTTFFHLDNYIGLPEHHPASFHDYLMSRIVRRVHPRVFHFIRGNTDPLHECERMSALIQGLSVDLACIGIGENGHIAFNDPPADFLTEVPFIVAKLDEADRRQQYGEGWFTSLEEVPKGGITMSIRQILRANNIVCVVPDRRKAQAVYNCLKKEISPSYPASILRTHVNTLILLDRESASLLPQGEYRELGATKLPPQRHAR